MVSAVAIARNAPHEHAGNERMDEQTSKAEGKATENVGTSREASINKMETTSKIKKGERQGISTKQTPCQATFPVPLHRSG
jgi:hypothetical protein